MTRSTAKIAALLFVSGLCALVYQTTWFRELRLVFGVSTAASAAVLAIFMGGLGFGGLYFGRRADRHVDPLALYARLEIAIAVAAAATPLLVVIVRWCYIAAGGVTALGELGATLLRLALALLVLGVPTFLMGGTFPAAARVVEQSGDLSRRRLSLVYGTNTLGAVAGAVLATFVLLEKLGNRGTLWSAAALNLALGVTALALARRTIAPRGEVQQSVAIARRAPVAFVLAAAAIVGFAFFLMELVWYRLLAPLLGGSTFTFGLVLAVALFGIGAGGAARGLRRSRETAQISSFAWTCGAEALLLAIPFALGDRIAVLAVSLRALSTHGFIGLVAGWSIVAAILILPAAIIAGAQFPLLIALLGSGDERVGRHTGLAYAANTVGAIAGSLAGGFGLIPALSAPGVWQFVVALLAITAVVSVTFGIAAKEPRLRFALPILCSAAAVFLLRAEGPTAAWRHTPIGAGRASLPPTATKNRFHDWLNQRRRSIAWEADGIESSVAMSDENGFAFLVSGKSDGHTRTDAATQVGLGIVGSLLVPDAQSAMVVGLGTGSTAGWAAAIPAMKRVDVVELEPVIRHVAELSAPVNRGVLSNPKVHVAFEDAREALLTSKQQYDLVISEPSNPYRAGVAGFFTEDFYRAVRDRLTPRGIVVQWVQAYEIDATTMDRIYATMLAVFPYVDTWRTTDRDILLIGSTTPQTISASQLGNLLAQEPYRSAFLLAWRAGSVEALLAHFIGDSRLAKRAAARVETTNTDDRNLVEFGFARQVGSHVNIGLEYLTREAHASGAEPHDYDGTDPILIEEARLSTATLNHSAALRLDTADTALRNRIEAHRAYVEGDLSRARAFWSAQRAEPADSVERFMVADFLAVSGDPLAEKYVAALRNDEPAEADVVFARLCLHQKRFHEAASALTRAFERYRFDPWPNQWFMEKGVDTAIDLVRADRTYAAAMFQLFERPFVLHLLNERRLFALVEFAVRTPPRPCNGRTIEALSNLEPDVPWQRRFLEMRAHCYEVTNDPRAARARRDVERFSADE